MPSLHLLTSTKLAIETLEKGVKCLKLINTPKQLR